MSLIITKNQYLMEFLPIMKLLFQCTKRGYFYTHYFIGDLAYVIISKHFMFKWIIWRLSSWKKKKWSPNFINSCIKSFVNNLYTPKVIVQNVPKTNVFVTLLFSESTSCQIWKKCFKNHLVINWDLLIKKSS